MRGQTIECTRRSGTEGTEGTGGKGGKGGKGATRSQRRAQRGAPEYQCQPGPRDGPRGGRGACRRTDRSALRRHRHRRRGRPSPGFRHHRSLRRGASATVGMARRTEMLRTLPRSGRSVETGGPFPLRARDRLFVGQSAYRLCLPGRADASPRREDRSPLPGRKGGRPGVHGRGRGGPPAARLAGGRRDCQRAQVSRRAAHQGRPRVTGRDFPGGRRGVRSGDRQSGVDEPGGEADRGEPASAGKTH